MSYFCEVFVRSRELADAIGALNSNRMEINDMADVVEILRVAGCPDSALTEATEWARTKRVTASDLYIWKLSAEAQP